MIAVKDIILDIRNKVGDVQGVIFPLRRLCFFINKVLRDISMTTDIFSTSEYIAIHNESNIIDLGDRAYKIQRIEDNKGYALKFKAHFEMDREYGLGWENLTGNKLECVVYDLQNTCTFKVFPRLESPHTGYDIESPWGILTGFLDDGIYYDIVSCSVPEAPYIIKVTYTRKFDEVSSIDDIIPFRNDITDMIGLGVLAECLLDNTATQNMQTYSYISQKYEEMKRAYRENTVLMNNTRTVHKTRRRII